MNMACPNDSTFFHQRASDDKNYVVIAQNNPLQASHHF